VAETTKSRNCNSYWILYTLRRRHHKPTFGRVKHLAYIAPFSSKGKPSAASGPHEQLVIEAEAERDGARGSDRGSREDAVKVDHVEAIVEIVKLRLRISH
jgi:hypothetical protein